MSAGIDLAGCVRQNKGDSTVESNNLDLYNTVFKEYPDVLDVKQVSDLMGVSTKTVYKLLNTNVISFLKVGREYRIPKITLMQYLKIIPDAAPV
jgi:excisionase family DNA binding protein